MSSQSVPHNCESALNLSHRVFNFDSYPTHTHVITLTDYPPYLSDLMSFGGQEMSGGHMKHSPGKPQQLCTSFPEQAYLSHPMRTIHVGLIRNTWWLKTQDLRHHIVFGLVDTNDFR